MISETLTRQIIELMQREVVPAVGCTEPVAVALCVARATELLGSCPAKLEVGLSANMLKNAMGVGIPGTGMNGLPIAIALGAVHGKSSDGLEVLANITPADVERGKSYIDSGAINIYLCENAPSKLYIDVKAISASGETARAVIKESHTNFVHEQKGDEVLMSHLHDDEGACGTESADEHADPKLNLRMVYDFAMETPLEQIAFIARAAELNINAADCAFRSPYGHSLGRIVAGEGLKYFGDTPLAHMIACTSAACDARMGGCPVTVMSNSGSGNQGITCTMPVVSFARDCNADREHTLRALALSNLVSIYIKQGLGRLSALCGCVVAGTGASSGIAYLMGADYDRICAAIKNMVANLTGMLCDGAKPSCAMKIASATSTAMMSALLAVNGQCASASEGIVCDDVDRTIHNLTSIGKDAMRQTDELVLKIMTTK